MKGRDRRPPVVPPADPTVGAPDVADARRAERARIGRELHDGVIQSLYALGLGLEETIQTLETDVPCARSRLILARDTINNLIAEVRVYVGELRAADDSRPRLATRFADVGAELGLDLTVEVAAQVEGMLTGEQREELYRIGREALTNVAKHARATRAQLVLGPVAGARRAGAWVLQVRDDGVGFAPDQVSPEGFGLGTMRERARVLGAELTVTSRLGSGTTIRIVHPSPRLRAARPGG